MIDLERLAPEVESRLLALPRARRCGDEISFSCMFGEKHSNGDRDPSASYSTLKRAYNCQGCHASGGLVSGKQPLAPLLGIDPDSYRSDGHEKKPHEGRPDRSWEIKNREGVTVATHNRWDLPGGKKKLRWETPGNPFGLGGIRSETLPLYGVDRLGEREPGDDMPTIVCEGEPATDALLEIGLRAVGTVTGASSVPCVEVLGDLRGENVVLWVDDDDIGRAHMAQVAARLESIATSVRVFAPDGLGDGGDAADWTRARATQPNLATLLLAEIEEHAQRVRPLAPDFAPLADDVGYRLTIPALAATLEVTQLRRERYQLRGEVHARCRLPGAITFDGTLSVADLNLSSDRARTTHAAHLAERACTDEKIWQDAVEELSQRVLAAERAGEPDVCLADVKPEQTRVLEVDGLKLPRHHSAVLFGDGDSAKSYIGLYALGRLAREGLRVGLADWELSGADHRERLGRLFPDGLPQIRYLRCARPIVQESERLRRWVRDHQLDYVVFDSVAFASAGAPESAEIAMQYFQVVRQLGQIGSLHIAHITKAVEGADRRPFGSAFWHNSPRATWFAKLADRDPGSTVSRLGLYPRKWNIGPMPAAVGLELTFTGDRTTVLPVDLAETAELASTLPVKQRMIAALRVGKLTLSELAETLEAPVDTVRKTARRHVNVFDVANGVVSLLERRHAG